MSVAAEALSRLFARRYEDAFGIAVPEWRVLAVLGESDGRWRTRTGACDPGDHRPHADGRGARQPRLRAPRRQGLVARRVNPGDQRARLLALTARGRDVYERIAPMALDLEQSLMAGFDEGERRTLETLLAKIRTRAAQVADEL